MTYNDKLTNYCKRKVKEKFSLRVAQRSVAPYYRCCGAKHRETQHEEERMHDGYFWESGEGPPAGYSSLPQP